LCGVLADWRASGVLRFVRARRLFHFVACGLVVYWVGQLNNHRGRRGGGAGFKWWGGALAE